MLRNMNFIKLMKNMYCLTTRLTHFIYGYTAYIIYIGHMVTVSQISQDYFLGYSFYMHHPIDGVVLTMAFDTLVVEQWMMNTVALLF